ncbi:MAG: PfkB family carbohydrate kinase [Spirochaetaceae bacterium]|jgi:sugar/nucleoside kinase (ribokinase family)|nr:PfkB family carbohydrate kinase [Spirochaetaceae bacterium]
MDKILVAGSTVADVIIRVGRLPPRGGDVNIETEEIQLGGCAYTVARAIIKALAGSGLGCRLCSPVGAGVYGDFVAGALAKEGIEPFVRVPEENGCCYCLVEADGERTFLCRRGAEYRFQPSWFQALPSEEAVAFRAAFVCGIDLDTPVLADYLIYLTKKARREKRQWTLYFAPGSRWEDIADETLTAMFAAHPFLHLSEGEAFGLTACSDVQTAAERLYQKTENSLVITLGKDGAYYREKDGEASRGGGHFVPAEAMSAPNTVGAGDTHCGALIAALERGIALPEAVREANRAAGEYLIAHSVSGVSSEA